MKTYDLSSVGRDDLDPGVEAALGRSARRVATSHMTASQRKAKAKEENKAKARKGKQALYDLDAEIIQRIRDMADKLGTSNSQVAQLGLAYFLQAVDRGEIDLTDYLKSSNKSPRYLYILEFSSFTT